MTATIDPSIPQAIREVVITRVFDAPRELVFRAWTEPKNLAEWWGQRLPVDHHALAEMQHPLWQRCLLPATISSL